MNNNHKHTHTNKQAVMSHSSTATPVNLPQLLLLSAPVYSIHLPLYSLNNDLDFKWFWQVAAVFFFFFWFCFGFLEFFFSLFFCFYASSFNEHYPAQHILMHKGHFLHLLLSMTGQLCRGEKIGSLCLFLLDTTVPVTYWVSNTQVLSAIWQLALHSTSCCSCSLPE